jgi:DNA polymerase-3 subunit delta'
MVYPWHKSGWTTLIQRKGKIHHALLLRGVQGIGKLAFAESLARALLCERPGADAAACGGCAACLWMSQGSHPDFRRLEPESLAESGETEAGSEKKEKASSQIPVEQVRALADFINVSTHRGGARIVLIHPAESLTTNAANALLKNLEEPSPNTHFLLVTHRWHQLLPTIKSRCQQVALPLPEASVAIAWLEQQGVGNAEIALAQAGGAPLLAAAYDDSYWQLRASFLKGIGARNVDALAVAEQLRDQAPALVVSQLQKWSYDLVNHKVTGAVRYNPDFATAIAAAAAKIDLLEATRFLRHVVRLQRIVAHPLNARLFFEELLLSYASLMRGRPIVRAA